MANTTTPTTNEKTEHPNKPKTVELANPPPESKGDCHKAAFTMLKEMYMLGVKDAEMVQGIPLGQGAIEGVRHTHSWVERNDWVMDFSNGKKLVIPAFLYYDAGCIDPDACKRYTFHQAVDMLIKYEIYSAWELPTDLELRNYE